MVEAILHIAPKTLQSILTQIDLIKTDKTCVSGILDKLNNFTTSYYKKDLFGHPIKDELIEEYLKSYQFKESFTDIFSNIFSVLSKIEITTEQFQDSKKPLLNFLKIETELNWYDLKAFSNFLLQKGNLFETSELLEILKIAIKGDNYDHRKYTDLIESLGNVIYKFYPNFEIKNAKLINTSILNSTSENGLNSNYIHLVPLLKICDDNCKRLLIRPIEEELHKNFKPRLYEELIENAEYDWKSNDYFKKYSNYVNLNMGGRTYKYGKLKLTDIIFFKFSFLVYKLHINFSREEFKSFTALNDFELWLINPFEYDYEKFNPKWLVDVNYDVFLSKLKDIDSIKSKLEGELLRSFNPTLAEIKYKYFSNA